MGIFEYFGLSRRKVFGYTASCLLWYGAYELGKVTVETAVDKAACVVFEGFTKIPPVVHSFVRVSGVNPVNRELKNKDLEGRISNP